MNVKIVRKENMASISDTKAQIMDELIQMTRSKEVEQSRKKEKYRDYMLKTVYRNPHEENSLLFSLIGNDTNHNQQKKENKMNQ